MTDIIPSPLKIMTYGSAAFAVAFTGLVLTYRVLIG
jgi:hypothetical protein